MEEKDRIEKEFKMKLKEIPIGVFIVQEEKFVYANKYFCNMVGYGMEEIEGMEVDKLVPPEEKEKFQEISSSLKKEKFPEFEAEIPLLHKDGKRKINVKIYKDMTKFKGEKICIGTVKELGLLENAVEEIFDFLGKFYSFFEEAGEAMYITSPEGKVLDVNPSAVDLFGYKSKENFIEANVKNHYINLKDRKDFQKAIEEEGSVKDYELTLKKKNGSLMDVSITANVLKDEEGKAVAYRGIIRNITEHKKIDEKLREFQKMEALGRLAGGIAHDFNNLLTVIIGNIAILLKKIKPEDPNYEKLKLVMETAEKASSLTSQLLTFSRNKFSPPENFNPNTLINKIAKFLSRTLGEKIRLELLLNPYVACIKADPNQMEQVILNLAINARDAMPEGGKLTISTDNAEVKGADFKLNPEAKPGKYAVIKVSDTGTGIPEEIIGQIFEPFFSTKEKGSGLGLSIVYGIVKQSGGYITVQSKPGKGTTFSIFIPASEERINNLLKPEEEERALNKREARIIVVEDDPSVLEYIVDVLESSGYKVIKASDGESAIIKAKDLKEGLSLLITDIVLPGKNGFETAREIFKIFPEIRVIFMSGYPSNKINQIFEFENFDFLQKPFTPSILLEKIDNILKNKN